MDGTFTPPPESEITPAFRAFAHGNDRPGFQVQAITGGDVVYSGDKYPAALQGAYFFADVSQGEIFAVNADDRRELDFLIKRQGALAPVHFGQGPDGYVYYADFAFGTIGRLEIVEPLVEIALEPLVDVVEADQDSGTTDEASTPYTFAATLSGPVAALVTVDYVATAGAFSTSGTLTFDPDAGDPLRAEVTINLPADAVVTSDETITVTLLNIVVGAGADPSRVLFVGGENSVAGTATYCEDDAPRLSIIAPAHAMEGDAGLSTLVFTTTLTEPAGPGGVTADVTVEGGAAFSPSSILIPEGETSATVTVEFEGDTQVELDETVTVTLSNVTNALEGMLTTSALILNDDIPPLNVVGDATFDAEAGEYILTTATADQTGAVGSVERIDLSRPATIAFDLNFGTSDGGADGTAFVLHNAPEGANALGSTGGGFGADGLENAIAIEFDTYENNGGGDIANDHTAFFDPDGAFASPPIDLGNIEDGGWRRIIVGWDPVGGAEGTGSLSLSIDGALVSVLEGDIVNDYLGGSQFAHFAFTAATGGLSNVQKVRFVGLDAAFESADEPPRLTLTAPADAAEGAEGETGTLTFVATLDQPSASGDVTAAVAITGGATGPSTVTIPQGETTVDIVLSFDGDALVEPDETITVTLYDLQNADPGTSLSESAVILDDDVPRLTLSAPAAVAEGDEGQNGTLTFIASLDQPAIAGEVTASVTISGNATGPSTVTIPQGQTSAEIALSFAGDALVEPDETITVTLSNLQNADPGDTLSASATILNDDTPALTLLAPVGVAEGDEGQNGTLTFIASLDQPAIAGDVTATVTINGNATGPSTVTIPQGQTSAEIALSFAGDALAEPDETITVTLSNLQNADPGDTLSAAATILNDDTPALTLLAPVGVAEGDEGQNGTLTFIASLDQPAIAGDVTASVTISGNVTGPSTVTIPQGQTSAEIALSFAGDALAEPDETITVTLSNLQNADPGDTLSASATIVDDDVAALPDTQLHFGSVTVRQPSRDVWFSVEFDAPIEDAVVVMGAVTDNCVQPAFANIRNVTDQGFEFRVEEWSYLDGRHIDETIGWAAMSAGSYMLSDGRKVVAGTTSAKNDFKWVGLSGFESTPVVFTQQKDDNDPAPAVTRIRNTSENGFQVRLREEEAADDRHALETIGFIAIEEGVGAGVSVATTPDAVTHRRYALDVTDSDLDSFVFLAEMQDHDGSDTAALRYGSTNSGVNIFVDEEQSRDDEISHTTETVGYLSTTSSAVQLFSEDVFIL